MAVGIAPARDRIAMSLRYQLVPFAAILALAFVPGEARYATTLISEVAIFGLLAVSFDVAFGIGGMLTLATALFFGLSAYMVHHALASLQLALPLAVLAGVAAAALAALLVGLTTSRVKGAAFMILSLIVVSAGASWAQSHREWTGGDDGLGLDAGVLTLFGAPLNAIAQYRISLILLAAGYAVALLYARSRFGRVAAAIRQNDLRAEYLGVNVAAVRVLTFVLSGAIAGLAGATHTIVFHHVHTGLLHWSVSAEALVYAYLGGLGTLAGPLLGAALMTAIKEATGQWAHVSELAVGVMLVAVIRFSPRGLVPLAGLLWRRLTAARGPVPGCLTRDVARLAQDVRNG
jgi:branched-chain amino acid transport system permease protein